MNAHVDRVDRVEELPDQWDALASETYQRRQFLQHCHTYNPCQQRYYLLSEDGDVRAGAVVYTLRLDLFTYLRVKSPMTMQIIGIPASVSCSGLVGMPALYCALLKAILRHEPGLVVCLNLESVPNECPMYVGRTWPDITLDRHFRSWEEYLSALRSDYRRRTMRVLDDSSRYEIQRTSCALFTAELHALYLEVFNRSQGKLECLNVAFFRNLPAPFCLSTYSAGGEVRAWTITVRDRNRLNFFLGGRDYSYDPKNLYLVTLLDIVKCGMDSAASFIDLGQSAEIPKMRLGGRVREKYMLACHNRMLPKLMLHAGMGVLSYRRRFPDTHVFKGEQQ